MTNTPDDMEKPAKRWEVAAVSRQQEAQSKQLQSIDLKIDKLLENQVTSQHVDDKIKVVDDKLDNAVKAIHLRYGPLVSNIRWVTRALITAILGILANVIVQLRSN